MIDCCKITKNGEYYYLSYLIKGLSASFVIAYRLEDTPSNINVKFVYDKSI